MQKCSKIENLLKKIYFLKSLENRFVFILCVLKGDVPYFCQVLKIIIVKDAVGRGKLQLTFKFWEKIKFSEKVCTGRHLWIYD